MSQKKIAVLSSTAERGKQVRGRVEFVAAAASLGLGFLGGISTPAVASHHHHHGVYGYATGDLGSPSRGGHRSHRRSGSDETAEARKPEPAKQPSGPLLLAISIGSQRVTVYDNGTPVAVSAVSTGMPGHLTPMGVFSVIQKQRWHHSNLYSNAPMPYMQRITWSGVALHAGVVPGHPASHGCIRLPERFAVRLWGMTKVGVRVVITRGEAAPYEIAHPRLAGLARASEAAFEPGPSNARSSAPPNRSEVATGTVVVATTGAVAGGAGTAASRDDSAPSSSEFAASASPQVESGAAPNKPAEAGPPAEPSPVEPAPAPKVENPLQQHPGPISLFVSRKVGKLFVRKGFAPVFDVPITIARPEEPLGTHIFTASRPANEGVGVRWLAISLGYDRAASRPEPAKRKGRATRDERPVPSTADALRQSAAAALDRIELPPEALERISPFMSPGASLLISDQGLGSETGRDTDFIVVTK